MIHLGGVGAQGNGVAWLFEQDQKGLFCFLCVGNQSESVESYIRTSACIWPC